MSHKHTKNHKRRRSPLIPLLLIVFCLLVAAVLLGLRKKTGELETRTLSTTPESAETATPAPTPEPTPTPTPEPTPSPYAHTELRVSEVCCGNTAMVPDENAAFGDWVELENYGADPLDLSGWALSDRDSGKNAWAFGEGTTIAPGGRMLVFCDRQNRRGSVNHTDFALSAGESVYLFDPTGALHASLSTEGLARGQSAALNADGTVTLSRFVTPGFENSEEGYLAWQESLSCASPLVINECVSSNNNSFQQYSAASRKLEYYDWVEIRNVSDQPLSTAGYYLSDRDDQRQMWAIPTRTLFPGDCWTFQCSGNEALTEQYFTHTNFKLDGEADGVYLFAPDGSLADYVFVHDVPNEGSIGKNGTAPGVFFMKKSSAHHDNGTGFRLYAHNPVALTEDGVFNGVESVSVELSADRTIYYTTDGSTPTLQSAVYTEPITLTQTGVIRACCCEEGKLTPRPLSLSYILNEEHTLPVVSVVTDNNNLFGPGIYDQWSLFDGRQVPASLSLYEQDGGGFTVDCGLKMFGHTGLKNAKKSLKVVFRSRFGSDSLSYDIFGDGNDTFTSLVLRAGQDCYFSVIRDELFQELSAEFSDKVLVQRDRYCILYINGQYWGLYALKDAYSEDYYAALRGVSSESVEKLQAPVAMGSEFWKNIYIFNQEHDMSLPENYDYFCSQVDIDSLIDWAIIEGYSANADVQQNLRFFRSTENGHRWEFAFYDLDWAFYYPNNLSCVFNGYGEDGSILQHTRYIAPLLKNEDFCDRFCKRLAEALGGALREENVLSKIDELCARIENEVPRDRDRWDMVSWENKVDALRTFVTNGWTEKMIDGAVQFCHLTAEQRAEYFGDLEA